MISEHGCKTDPNHGLRARVQGWTFTVIVMSSVERQKGLTTGHWLIQLDFYCVGTKDMLILFKVGLCLIYTIFKEKH